MDITKGSLDEIARPASTERSRPGSRVSSVSLQERGKVNHAVSGTLEVLSPDVQGAQDCKSVPGNIFSTLVSEDVSHGQTTGQADSSEGSTLPGSSHDSDHSHAEGSDEEHEDPDLRKAIKKMKRLDNVLAVRISKEKEVKRRGKELHQKLWQELQEMKPQVALERPDEAENTRLFLALASNTSDVGEEGDHNVLFETQVPDNQGDSDEKLWKESDLDHSEMADSFKVGQEGRMAEQSEGRQRGVDRGKKKHDFVKKNMELARDAGSQVVMTAAEKVRLAEILWDVDDGDGGPMDEETAPSLRAMPVSAGQGYTPEPAELDQLLHIDSRLQLLLPEENFLSLHNSYANWSSPEGLRSGWDSERDRLPGEKVLQAMRETREQETRLREIEQQLEKNQGITSGEPILSEGQLRSLLEDCVLALSRMPTMGTEAGDMPPRALSNSPCTLLGSTPSLSDSLLSELLRSARSPETPLLGNGTSCG